MNRDQMIAHLGLQGYAPAMGHIPYLWYGLYDPIGKTLVQDYEAPHQYGISVAEDFSHTEMTVHGDCYAKWEDIPTDWLSAFALYLEQETSKWI